MRQLGTTILALMLLSGCGLFGDEDGSDEPSRINGNAPSIVKLIEERYKTCLADLDAGPVHFTQDNLYTADAAAGPLDWAATTSGTGEILTTPLATTIPTLQTVDCDVVK